MLPAPPPPAAAVYTFKIGDNIDHSRTTKRVLTEPAIKLFRWHCKDGRYRNPEPEECGGIMKIS